MKISEASNLSGLPVKTIRYYESIGLFKSNRESNGYRNYTDSMVSEMKFLSHSRQLGFNLDDCRDLLALFQDPHRASKSVKEVAERRLQLIDKQIIHLKEMKQTLNRLVTECPGNDDSDCIILDELASN